MPYPPSGAPPGGMGLVGPSGAPPPLTAAEIASKTSALGVLEYVLRLVFFACVPFGVVILSQVVPMGAALVNMLLALTAFFFGEMLYGAAEKRPWLKRVLRRQLAFEAYYRQHPPRPFLYYVFYPLLMPYWLIKSEARREFILFKGYTIVTILIVSIVGAYRYFFVYQPELSAKPFFIAFGIGLVIETFAVMMFIMPMTTSVVALHRKRQHRRLVVLLVVGLLSAGVAAGLMAQRHRTFPSLETRQRVSLRTAVKRPVAKEAMRKALVEAWRVRRVGKRDQWERDADGTVLGAPLDAAREKLETFYRSDEAGAFELWASSRNERPPVMILFAEGRKKGNPVWLGMRADGTLVENLKEVPKAARTAMRTAGEL